MLFDVSEINLLNKNWKKGAIWSDKHLLSLKNILFIAYSIIFYSITINNVNNHICTHTVWSTQISSFLIHKKRYRCTSFTISTQASFTHDSACWNVSNCCLFCTEVTNTWRTIRSLRAKKNLPVLGRVIVLTGLVGGVHKLPTLGGGGRTSPHGDGGSPSPCQITVKDDQSTDIKANSAVKACNVIWLSLIIYN